ncbi:MAG: ABC transporter substrate-binding protein [Actinobacteria bacterium]|nr:ABC transporter substrate-binding protein [Actinomycetota bacterium]
MSGHACNARSGRARRPAARYPTARRPAARRRLWPAPLLAVAGLLVLLTACTGTRSGSTATPGATSPTSTTNKDFIRLVVPPGPVQNGNVDPRNDWVTPFEEQTGCRVDLVNAPTDAAVYADLTKGIGNSYYDGVLASPTVAGQLIGAKAVAPLSTSGISGYSRVSPRLASAAPEVSGGRTYGLPYLWDSYVTGYAAGQVKPAPQTWTALFSPSSAKAYSGKITIPQDPITLALAALYLKSAQPSLGISDPFELTSGQLSQAENAVQAVRPDIGTYWNSDAAVIGQLGDGQDVLGAVLTHQLNEMTRAGLPLAGVPTLTRAAGSGPQVAFLYSWMVTAHAANTKCTYQWMSWTTSNYVQERASAFTSAAPVAPAACTGPAAANCAAYHMSSLPSARNIVFQHLPVTGCGQAGGCASYASWEAAWKRVTAAAGVPAAPSAVASPG